MDTNTISEVLCKQGFRVNIFRKKKLLEFLYEETHTRIKKKKKKKKKRKKETRQQKCIPRFLEVFVVQLRNAFRIFGVEHTGVVAFN